MPKCRNPPTKYEIHCLEIKIHKGHEIHSKATLAKYRNAQNPQTTESTLAFGEPVGLGQIVLLLM